MSFFKRNWAFFLVILIILIFTFQIVLYYSTFRNFDFGWNVFSGLADKTWNVDQSGNIIDDGLESKWGTFGDFMGGVLNPILGFITIILLLISHEKDSKRAEKHEEQREIDLFITRLQYLKSIQQDHVKGLNLIKLDEKGNVSYIPQGNFFFTILLNALSLTMKTARENNNLSSLRQEDLLTVCVGLLFYGNNKHYREFIQKNYIHINYQTDIVPFIRKLKRNLQALWDYELLSGLRTQLSPYFRILFHIVETIDNNRIIDEKLKYELIKDVRVMLSSQEQLLLLLNSLTSFGEKWNEKNLIVNYKLCRNIGAQENFSEINLKQVVFNLIDASKILDKESYKKSYFE